jgi:hypothetical protein
MKILEFLTEANVGSKIKDPKVIKQLSIAMRHDGTLPKASVAKLGPKPNDQDILSLWSTILDSSLSSTRYGNLSTDGKFDDWLTRLYINGQADYEDINGEGGDALGAWKALSIRGLLTAEHQDFNRFKNLRQIQLIVNKQQYRKELRRIEDQATIEQHKRERKEIVLMDNDRFFVVIPLNYGACYTFNNALGFQASFCTGSSSGLHWFNRYSVDGPIISIFDKSNPDDVNGKWQMHAATNQLNNGDQSVNRRQGDELFAKLFPGLMMSIVKSLEVYGDIVKKESQSIVANGYNIIEAIDDIKNKFPMSYNSLPNKTADQQG